ncbi:MAG TPA: thioredoxin family protein [Anaerovoracaceae bacterium]|nr:thioredoxin family protein [Anaerovoracaceae bacterium]
MSGNKRQNLIRIIASVLIVMVVVGIWFIKNGSEKESIAGSDNLDFELEVTSLDLDQLKSYGLPIIIDFGSDSCIPCKEMAPVLKELNSELRGKAIVKFVDVWKYPKLAEGYPISVIPTQLFFDKDGKPYTPSDPEGMSMTLYQTKDTNEHIFTAHEGGITKDQLLDALSEMGMEE